VVERRGSMIRISVLRFATCFFSLAPGSAGLGCFGWVVSGEVLRSVLFRRFGSWMFGRCWEFLMPEEFLARIEEA
jgi:hypothetical protein